MIVCSCNVLTDGQVRDCLGPGPGCPRTAAQVYQCLGCSAKCGRCARTIRQIMANALGTEVETACASACVAACPMQTAETSGRVGVEQVVAVKVVAVRVSAAKVVTFADPGPMADEIESLATA